LAGYDGQNSLDGPLNKQGAKRQFETKFKSKTSGNWSDRDSLVRDPKKYYYLKTSYDFKDPAEEAKPEDGASSSNDPKTTQVACKLPDRLQHLVRLVCNVDEMAKQMSEVFP
jgi:poly [ADP-ribose] polymerase